MYKFKTLLYSTITILFNLLFISKLYALGINDLKIQKLHDFEYAWGMDLIDNENILVSEKKGVLYIYNFWNGKIVGKEIYNDVLSKRQGGLLDIIFVIYNSTPKMTTTSWLILRGKNNLLVKEFELL